MSKRRPTNRQSFANVFSSYDNAVREARARIFSDPDLRALDKAKKDKRIEKQLQDPIIRSTLKFKKGSFES